jgi:hypothetical protein
MFQFQARARHFSLFYSVPISSEVQSPSFPVDTENPLAGVNDRSVKLTTRHDLISRSVSVNVRSEVFTAVTMKNDVFWDVMPCDSCKNRRFGGT